MTPSNVSGSAISRRSQPRATSSSSVAAGDVRHSIACWFKRRGEELREDAGRAARDREVGEEAGMIPVGDAGQDDPLEVREDGVELFALLRGARRERAANLTGANAREDRKAFRVVEVIGDPVGDAMGLWRKSFNLEIWKSGNWKSTLQIPTFPNSQISKSIRRLSTVIVAGAESLTVMSCPAAMVTTVRSPDMTAAVPPAAPMALPVAAPLPPPMMPPRIAPAIAAPPIFLALEAAGDSASRKIGSVRSATSLPSASTSVWNRIPMWAGVLTLPPLSTSMTVPITRAPAGIATRPAAMTSRDTRACTRSSTRARSDETDVSSCRPITDADGRIDFLELRRARRLGLHLRFRRLRNGRRRHGRRHGGRRRFGGGCVTGAATGRRSRAGGFRTLAGGATGAGFGAGVSARRGVAAGTGSASAFSDLGGCGRVALGAAHDGFGLRHRGLSLTHAAGRCRCRRGRGGRRGDGDLLSIVTVCDVRPPAAAVTHPRASRTNASGLENIEMTPCAFRTEQGAYPSNRPQF